jgi:hypothetical protein
MTANTSHTMNKTTEASAPTKSKEEVRVGVVHAYSVSADRLMIKFSQVTGSGGPETARILLSVSADAPHFRSAVSMVMMMAHTDHGSKYLAVRYSLPIVLTPVGEPEVNQLLEIGFGGIDPWSALSFNDWPT